jgi:hypothetical protein
MKLTETMLNMGMSINNGFSAKQLRVLGLPDNCFDRKSGYMLSGWRKKVIGSDVTQKQYDDFLALKDKHLENKRRFTPMKDLLFGKEQTLEENHLQSICSEPQNSSNPAYRRIKYRQRGYSDEEIKRIMS